MFRCVHVGLSPGLPTVRSVGSSGAGRIFFVRGQSPDVHPTVPFVYFRTVEIDLKHHAQHTNFVNITFFIVSESKYKRSLASKPFLVAKQPW